MSEKTQAPTDAHLLQMLNIKEAQIKELQDSLVIAEFLTENVQARASELAALLKPLNLPSARDKWSEAPVLPIMQSLTPELQAAVAKALGQPDASDDECRGFCIELLSQAVSNLIEGRVQLPEPSDRERRGLRMIRTGDVTSSADAEAADRWIDRVLGDVPQMNDDKSLNKEDSVRRIAGDLKRALQDAINIAKRLDEHRNYSGRIEGWHGLVQLADKVLR